MTGISPCGRIGDSDSEVQFIYSITLKKGAVITLAFWKPCTTGLIFSVSFYHSVGNIHRLAGSIHLGGIRDRLVIHENDSVGDDGCTCIVSARSSCEAFTGVHGRTAWWVELGLPSTGQAHPAFQVLRSAQSLCQRRSHLTSNPSPPPSAVKPAISHPRLPFPRNSANVATVLAPSRGTAWDMTVRLKCSTQ